MEYFIEKNRSTIILAALILVALDGFVWFSISGGNAAVKAPEVFFLDIGQGDSSLVKFPGGIEAIIDGGPGAAVLSRLADALPATDRYIDLVFLTHPEADHIAGLIDIIKRYDVGAVLTNGDVKNTGAYGELVQIVKEKKIPVVVLRRGDAVRLGSRALRVLWPPEEQRAGSFNERGLVIKLESPEFSALFTADIGFETEALLLSAPPAGGLRADILKVPHHGSKYSSSREFLGAVNPRISIIQTGKNSYGHPTAEALGRLEDIGSRIFRNDKDGTVKITAENGMLRVSAKK